MLEYNTNFHDLILILLLDTEMIDVIKKHGLDIDTLIVVIILNID